MFAASIPSDLLLELVQAHEHHPDQFFHIAADRMTSPVLREGLAELRNNGYVEEETRGVVRLTSRGYKAFQREHVTASDQPGMPDLPAWA